MKCPNCQTENQDGSAFCRRCGKSLQSSTTCTHCGHENLPDSLFCNECGQSLAKPSPPLTPPTNFADTPSSFANGRYTVKKKLGEGGKKKVYLAHDTVLDRDVAFALIKTEGLDDSARTRITREAQAMGRLGDHPHIVTVFDYGDEAGQPYIVQPCITGGDVEDLIKKAPEHKVPIDEVIKIGRAVCQGLIFSHSQGIIHRDLKPGNVMLTADGTAKICDFGLAIAMDMSRLTVAGMMVGTVSYMPPEQAMGGQVSEKADLYSLGAMLYEMVTGRPPFVGDDSISIIGQHINTPPVSPSWHRAELPPALETLIMQLLEKDPEKRPASAQVVLEALEAIEPEKTSREPSVQAPALTDNPLYRRVFVGREQEQKQLQAAFDAALSGQGALMMVVGEPGIGKTALTEQVATYVKLRGGRTLVGHCYEEGSLSLPYLAFVEAMRTYVLDREPGALRNELGTGAADVARIVSEVREKLKVRPRAKVQPEEERYRLMQGVSDFLCHAANVQPMLIVLEDLHDADKGTLDMLTHVSRHLAGSRLLIIGTYRDVEVDRSHPLSAALAELRRLATYGRVLLRGLNADEVRRMLEGITHEEVPWGLAEAVHRQTEGNPLFVQEVVRYLVEEGLLDQQGGGYKPTRDTPLEMSIPEGLRDVIGKRLSLISGECNQLLSVASVIGRDFPLDILTSVSGLDEEHLVAALKEAKNAAIIEERTGPAAVVSYRFTHAFFRQTLYEELIAPRRLKMHQQVARAMEQLYAKRLGEHATELAEHFSQSTDPADLKKAVEYGGMAARRASEVYAYGEAVRLLDQAVSVQRVLDADDGASLCVLLTDLCEALYLTANTRRLITTEAPAALALAESLGDEVKAVRICLFAIFAIALEQFNFTSSEAAEWIERIDRHAEPGTIERAYADMALGARKRWTGDRSGGLILLQNSLDLARSLGDQSAVWLITAILLMHLGVPRDFEKRIRVAQDLWAGPHTGFNTLSFFVLFWLIEAAMTAGDRRTAEEAFTVLRDFADRTGNILVTLMSSMTEAGLAVMDGRFDRAIDIMTSAQAQVENTGAQAIGALFGSPAVKSWIYTGAFADEENATVVNIAAMPNRSIVLDGYLGNREAVARILNERVIQRPNSGTDEDTTVLPQEVAYLEAAITIGDVRAAEAAARNLDIPGLHTAGVIYPACITRLLGDTAVLLGRHDEARRHYQEAIKVCTEMPFRPELALSRLQLAELILEHYPDEKKEALEHLDFAIKEFREMKMQPSLERALRHKDILKA